LGRASRLLSCCGDAALLLTLNLILKPSTPLQDACNVGDEGGFAPNIGSNEEGLNLVNQAIEVCSQTLLWFQDPGSML
jgi:enolase